MAKVSIRFIKSHLWLRSGNAELLITPEHIVQLHKRHDKKEFADYFLRQALLNRPARKLFQSWTRKDAELWRKIYALIISLKLESDPPANTENVIEAEASDAEVHAEAREAGADTDSTGKTSEASPAATDAGTDEADAADKTADKE